MYKNFQATAPLTLLFAASTIVLKAGFKLAPPTKNPSISSCYMRFMQFLSLTDPKYIKITFI